MAITALEVVVVFWQHPVAVQTHEVLIGNVRIERAAPTPQPAPTPRATPPPVPATQDPQAERAAPRAAHAPGASSVVRPHAAHPVHPATVASLTGNGAGSGSGSGSAAGDDAGAGNGSGGAGSGAVDAGAPCGYVEFIPSEAPKIVGGTSYETIRATVHYPDGHTESHDFPYPWVYPDWMNTDPWSPVNVRKSGLTALMQLPPPGADVHRYDDAIRYIIEHTGPAGGTLLQPCPGNR